MGALPIVVIAILLFFIYDRSQKLEVGKDFASNPETPCKLIHGVRGAEVSMILFLIFHSCF